MTSVAATTPASEEKKEGESSDNASTTTTTCNNSTSTASAATFRCLLEGLTEEVSSQILCHLTLEELATVSLVSKSLYQQCRTNSLWKFLLEFRWNVQRDKDTNVYQTYQRAHENPHDLWVTHWNCSFPTDGLSPGRCCIRAIIPKTATTTTTAANKKEQSPFGASCCPQCRDWQWFEELPSQTQAQRMALSTSCLWRNFRHQFSMWETETYCERHARLAFAAAATFHRTLDLQQYEQPSLCFLKDLLFFNIVSPYHSDGKWELEQLLQETDAEIDPRHETSLHSWHVIQLTNPDFYRPIIYQFLVQRPECFAVFPSEGYLAPGQTISVTVSVRPLGSALAYAFEALNVSRDGLDCQWADLYSEEAHLPLCPFVIRYRFAATQPASVLDPLSPRRINDPSVRQEGLSASRSEALHYHWTQRVPAHQIRTVFLSAHVNAHYSWWTFLQKTCSPFNSLDHGPRYVAPQLHEFYPDIFRIVENIDNDEDRSLVNRYTEGPCSSCGRSWGAREEEEAHSFLRMQGACQWHKDRERDVMRNMETVLQVLESNPVGSLRRAACLLYEASNIVVAFKAVPYLTFNEKQSLLRLEAKFDRLYHQISADREEDWVPWRTSGVFKYALCSESVFQNADGTLALFEEGNDDNMEAKDEPDFLDPFRYFAHSPGRFCLGPQEDPHHLLDPPIASSSRYFRRHRGHTTDLFMDDPISSFQAAICMMNDPRSLLLHGLYDLIPYPGTVVRRPQLMIPPICHYQSRVGGGNACTDPMTTYYYLQENVSLLSYNQGTEKLDGMAMGSGSANIFPCMSFYNYIHFVPPPGVGRFALSYLSECNSLPSQGPVSSQIIPLSSLIVSETSTKQVNALQNDNGAHDPTVNESDTVLRPGGREAPHDVRGPRFAHILWVVGAQFGLAVVDCPERLSIYIDRRILIALHWVCISLMAVPYLLILIARSFYWVPARPLDYDLDGVLDYDMDGVPFFVPNKLRYPSEFESGLAGVVLVFVWLYLGRWVERHTMRDYWRVMLDHVSPIMLKGGMCAWFSSFRSAIKLRLQIFWDAICPLFLQRRVFTPHWNRRSPIELVRHISFWKSRNLRNQRVSALPVDFRRLFGDGRDRGVRLGNDLFTRNIIVGVMMACGTFRSASPHFWLNLTTIFSCSISLGMSISLHSIEKGASSVSRVNTGAFLTTFNLATVVILSSLIGQLVGSSGGTMFLAEFIVTAISLLLGGAGTISPSAMESWVCFFCLSIAAFWGYLFGRVALMDGVRSKKRGYSTLLLSNSVSLLLVFWILTLGLCRWTAPIDLVVVTSIPSAMETNRGKAGAHKEIGMRLQ